MMQPIEAWHSLEAEEVLGKLETSPQGLSEAEARLRQEAYGKNILAAAGDHGVVFFLSRQIKNPLVLFLFAASIGSFFLGEKTDSLIILAAAILNVGIGFFQEFQANQTFQKLQKEIKIKAIVLRNGKQALVDAAELVPGDIILIAAGDKVPADARLVSASFLEANEAVLTGEWLGEEKVTYALPMEAPLAERKNMLWQGAIIEEGRAVAVITTTGEETEFGRLAKKAERALRIETPLQKDIKNLAKFISRAAGALIFFLFIFGILRSQPVVEMFLISVAVAVAAVPEGLPAAVSIVLAVGMKRILAKRGLVRQILATETLGRTSVILTDKTGTLTEAKMQVARIVTGHETLPHDGKRLPREVLNSDAGHALALKIGIFTSEAFVENVESGLKEWIPRGKPTDKAFLVAAIQAGLEPPKIFQEEPRIDFLPFSPVRKFAVSLHKLDHAYRMYIVGAPEIILGKSKDWYDEGRTLSLDKEAESLFLTRMNEVEETGERMIGVAYRDLKLHDINRNIPRKEEEISQILQDLVFVGLVVFHDPVREDVKETMKFVEEASLLPIIVTGDHLLTAKAVAERVGLFLKPEDILESRELAKFSDEELQKFVHRWKMYVRAVPDDKLRIVRAWQARDEVVAMVGDGVNDAPALKQADIGIALGSGTEVAKEASQLVLLDDSFSTIVRAIEQGRVILDNIRKIITYLLSTGFTEIILIGGSLLFRLPLPLLAPQILWINLIIEGLQTFPLAFEPKENDVMRQPPLRRKGSLFTKEMLVLIFIVGLVTDLYLFGLYLWLLGQGKDILVIRTIVFFALALAATFTVFALKSLRQSIWQTPLLKNRVHLWATIVSVGLIFLAVIFEPLSRILQLQMISFREFLLAFLIGIANLLTIEFVKLYFIRKKKF